MKSFFVYRNLHTKTFSVRFDGKVISHPSALFLLDVTLKVSAKGRARVLRERRKNVHATLQAKDLYVISGGLDIDLSNLTELYYNPYEVDSFVIKHSGEPIKKVDWVLAINNKIYTKE